METPNSKWIRKQLQRLRRRWIVFSRQRELQFNFRRCIVLFRQSKKFLLLFCFTILATFNLVLQDLLSGVVIVNESFNQFSVLTTRWSPSEIGGKVVGRIFKGSSLLAHLSSMDTNASGKPTKVCNDGTLLYATCSACKLLFTAWETLTCYKPTVNQR